jgi:hypothetical protein
VRPVVGAGRAATSGAEAVPGDTVLVHQARQMTVMCAFSDSPEVTPSSRATSVTVRPEEATSATASRLNSSG